MSWLVGETGYSFFDIWTVPHLAFWIFVGSLLWPFVKNNGRAVWFIALGGCLTAAYCWEIFERFAEVQWPTLWLHPESPWNSYASDPLTTVIGVLGMMWALNRWAR